MSPPLVIQSAAPHCPHWVKRCLYSVEQWADRQGFDRIFLGDEFFDIVPPVWRAEAGPEKLPATDYARLLWIRRHHQEGHDHVVWLDADILILNQQFRLPQDDFLCRELWIYEQAEGGYGGIPAVNNCAMGFRAGSPLLTWYIDACADAPRDGFLSKLALGPDLLKVRHRASPLPTISSIPTLSPLLIQALLRDDEELLRAFSKLWGAPIAGVHLCSSVGDWSLGPGTIAPDLVNAVITKLQNTLSSADPTN